MVMTIQHKIYLFPAFVTTAAFANSINKFYRLEIANIWPIYWWANRIVAHQSKTLSSRIAHSARLQPHGSALTCILDTLSNTDQRSEELPYFADKN